MTHIDNTDKRVPATCARQSVIVWQQVTHSCQLDVGETTAARGMILTRLVGNVKNRLIVYSNSENVAQLFMIFSDFVRFIATSGQLISLKW